MKTKINILRGLSELINKLSDTELVSVVLATAMLFMYISWELGRSFV